MSEIKLALRSLYRVLRLGLKRLVVIQPIYGLLFESLQLELSGIYRKESPPGHG